MSLVVHLQCVSCAKTFSTQEIDYTCPDCGPLKGTLDVIYDYEKVAKELTKSYLEKNRQFTHWRYLPLLPILKEELIPSLAVGWTPMYQAKSLQQEWGIKSLWIKDDGRNPSASYKDRASSIGVVKALEKGVKKVTAASTGNAASSWAAFTTICGLETIIFVPHNAPKAKIAQLLLYGATVLQVNGNYDQAFDLCCRAAEKWGWYNRCTAINPYLGEGKKTGAFEICEQLNWQVPDFVVVAVGDGCIVQGIWKGFQEFYKLKFIEKLPKIIGVQAQGSSPLVTAWEQNTNEVIAIEPCTIADSISVGVPRDQVKALRAITESQGQFIAVSDQEILDAISLTARNVGVLAEPSAAAALAGLKKLIAKGDCGKDHSAVVCITGHGLKDIEGVMKTVDKQPVAIDAFLEEVQNVLNVSN